MEHGYSTVKDLNPESFASLPLSADSAAYPAEGRVPEKSGWARLQMLKSDPRKGP
jgi:hypothetical protein